MTKKLALIAVLVASSGALDRGRQCVSFGIERTSQAQWMGNLRSQESPTEGP
jgi:hypothetical protein